MRSLPKISWRENVAVVYCPERIVAGATQDLRAAVMHAIEGGGRVILQMESVQYIDSTGLGLLAWLCVSARKRSGDVKLVAPSAPVQELLEITMLGRVFTSHPTVEAALTAFSTAADARETEH